MHRQIETTTMENEASIVGGEPNIFMDGYEMKTLERSGELGRDADITPYYGIC